MKDQRFNRRSAIVAATAGALAAPAIAKAQPRLRWRCVTSWPRNLIGPGISAARLVSRINTMSNGELSVDLFAAGEVVPALNVFDAVSNGTVEMGHSAALFWQGKLPAAALFTTVPFGLPPTAHAAWIDQEGQSLWDQLYAPFRLKAFLAGNTGPSTAGWFRKPITSAEDLAGLRIRVAGLGGEIFRRLGATPVTIAPGETYQALERGLIDAAEFLAPVNDAALGLYRVAPNLAFPGFNKPNGASELQIGLQHWNALPDHLRMIIQIASRAEHDEGLADAERGNASALRQVVAAGAQPMLLPNDVLEKAASAAAETLAEIAGRDRISQRIVESYQAAMSTSGPWSQAQGLPRIIAFRKSPLPNRP
jgi:TRAP-type mannitol/chloroaromatic compound transport system substrate-binding protein